MESFQYGFQVLLYILGGITLTRIIIRLNEPSEKAQLITLIRKNLNSREQLKKAIRSINTIIAEEKKG